MRWWWRVGWWSDGGERGDDLITLNDVVARCCECGGEVLWVSWRGAVSVVASVKRRVFRRMEMKNYEGAVQKYVCMACNDGRRREELHGVLWWQEERRIAWHAMMAGREKNCMVCYDGRRREELPSFCCRGKYGVTGRCVSSLGGWGRCLITSHTSFTQEIWTCLSVLRRAQNKSPGTWIISSFVQKMWKTQCKFIALPAVEIFLNQNGQHRSRASR